MVKDVFLSLHGKFFDILEIEVMWRYFLAATAGKKAVKEVGEEVVEKAVKETVEEVAEASGKKALKPEFDVRFVYSLDEFLFNSKTNFRETNQLV